MKEQTIITNFQQLHNKYNKLIELTQKNLQQVYMIQTATSMTIEALTNLLIEKNAITKEDIKIYLQKEHEKRSGKSVESKEKELETQPIIDTGSEISIPMEGENNE